MDQILDFGRTRVVKTKPLDLGAFVKEVAHVLRRTIREDILLQVETSSSPCIIDADAARIQQILLNLATNARDAMPNGGELRFAVKCHQGQPGSRPLEGSDDVTQWARLTVTDTGVGMPEEAWQHLFEPFFTTKGPQRGTGLGLAQVYGVVKQHGGRIDVESARNEGTTFTIYFPLMEDVPPAGTADTEPGIVAGQGETVLVVEDAEQILRAVNVGLTSLNYRVLCAANGLQALEMLGVEAVDLVLTDLVMPEMGGQALLQALREQGYPVPVLAMTGYAADGHDERLSDDDLRERGFADVIRKPFSIDELAALVRQALN